MTKAEALTLCTELEEMIGDGPGDVHGCQDKIKKTAFLFRAHPDGFLREKASDATSFLEIWRSPRKWQQWGEDPTRISSIVRNAVAGLEQAINRVYRDDLGIR